MDGDQTQRRPVLLFAFANDERPGRRLGGLCREIEEIRRTLAHVERDGACEVVVRESTTPEELVEVLEDPRYRRRLTVVHFAGHASGTRLLLEGEGEPVAARVQGLAPLLGELDSLALVFLNGCGTVVHGEHLVRVGIPAVVATEHPVDDGHAQRFAVDFYRSIAAGSSVAVAFARALAQAQCFEPASGVARDFVTTSLDEDPPAPWRLLLGDPCGDAKDWSLPSAAADPLFGLPAPVGGVLPQEPFMGLRRFTARESAVFFGRGRAIRNLYEDVTDPTIPPVVVVYGASGVGKSSLIEAGLLPRVAAGSEVHDLRLERGVDPEARLREVLGNVDERTSLAAAWRAREQARGKPLVVWIDQLEVLLVEDGGGKALARFVRACKPLGDVERPQGKLLLGLRKEWFPELRNELKRQGVEWHEHFVEPLGRDHIEEVVLGPTRTASLRARYGITCEHGLARRIADDLSQDRRSATAPMLQILLTRMWEHSEPQLTSVDGRARRRFTLETYDALRRDGLALSDFVDRQLEALRAAHERELASGLVLDLLFRHTTPRGTAAASTHAELRESYAHEWEVVEALIESCVSLYLLTPYADANGVDVGVRLAHDTLAPIVRERHRRSKAPGQAAARLLDARMGMSDASGRSRLLDEHDLAQVEAAQAGMRRWTEEEARLVGESRRRRTWAVWGRRARTALLVMSLAGGVGAWVVPRLDSPEEAVVTSSVRLGVLPQESSVRREDGDQRPHLAASPSMPSAASTAVDVQREGDVPAEPVVPPSDVEALIDMVAPASSGSTSAARVPTTAKGRSEASCDSWAVPLDTGTNVAIGAMAVHPDGARLAVGLAQRKKLFVLEQPWEASRDPVMVATEHGISHLAWSHDGDRLVIGEKRGGVQLATWPSWQAPSTCDGHERVVVVAAFSTDGSRLVTADESGRVIARNGRTCEPIDVFELGAPVHDLAEQATARWLVAGSGGRLAVWTGRGAALSWWSSKGLALRGIAVDAVGGRTIAVGQRLRAWDRRGAVLVDEPLKPAGQWVFVSDDGDSVLTAGSSGVQLWRLEGTTARLLDVWPSGDITVTDVAALPGSKASDVLVVSADGSVRWLQWMGDGLEELRPLDIDATDGGELVIDPKLRYFAVGDHAGRVVLVKLPTDLEQARRCLLNNVP